MRDAFRRGYGAILGSLLLLLALYPLLAQSAWMARVLDLAFVGLIATALARTWDRKSQFWIGLVLGSCSVVLNGLVAYTGHHVVVWSHVTSLAFQVWLMVTILVDIAKREKVTTDAVLGGGCIYILMALSWAHVYTICETLGPGTFSFPDADLSNPVLRHGALVYFSLITLTTVGYGDITPVAFSVRYMAAVEGAVAQLFLVIAMARLVSLEISQRMRDEP